MELNQKDIIIYSIHFTGDMTDSNNYRESVAASQIDTLKAIGETIAEYTGTLIASKNNPSSMKKLIKVMRKKINVKKSEEIQLEALFSFVRSFSN